MSAEKYSSAIKSIKTELSRYTHRSVFSMSVQYLRTRNTDAVEEVKKMPWLVMLLVKFSFLEPEGVLEINDSQFYLIANKLYSLQGLASNIKTRPLELKLRALTVQQLWYQQSHQKDYLSLIRQSHLMRRDDGFYDKKFREMTGIDIDNFFTIALYMMTLARSDAASNVLEVSLPSVIFDLTPNIPLTQLAKFFELLAIKFEDISGFLKKGHELKGEPQSEYFQETPFKLKPIVIDGSSVYIFNSRVFVTGVSLLLPALLKKKINNYKSEFGADMESYAGRLIAISGLQHITESEIGQLYASTGLRAKFKEEGISGKVVDFALSDGKDRIVLIECKAVEPSDVVKASYDPEVLRASLENSFINAIVQGEETKFILSKIPEFEGKKFKLIVITHQEFNIFGGAMVGECIDFGLEDRLCKKYGKLPIELSDVAYVTVGNFESLMSAHSIGEINFHDFIDECLQQQLNPAGKRFSMSQMVEEKIKVSVPQIPELSAEMELHTNRIFSAMKGSKARWIGKTAKFISASNYLTAHIRAK